MDEVSSLMIECLALETIAAMSRAVIKGESPNAPQWLKRANEILHAQFSENIRLKDLAKSVGVHPVHLARVFRRFNQCSVGEYMRKLRVDFASQELIRTERPLVDISSEAGFSDQGHFSRIFKQHTGLTPAEFRKQLSLR